MTGIANLLKPSFVRKEYDLIRVNDQVIRVIMAVGYPRTIREGWLDRIISSEGNFDLSMHIKPYPIETVLTQLNTELVKQEADLMAAQMKGIVNPSLKIQQQDTLSVLEKLQKGEEKLFNISLYIGARSCSREKLDLLTKKIVSELNSMMIIPKMPCMGMADGLKSVYPIQEDKLKADRNIPGDALAACFPFTTAYLNLDPEGILFGLGRNNIPVILDPFKFPNYNGLILGTSGGGKSVTAKLFILRNLLHGVKTTVIDPQGEYTELTKAHGGQAVEIRKGSNSTINPFDLTGAAGPEEKTVVLADLFRIMCGELTEWQKSILERAIRTAYGQKGIVQADSATWGKEPPVLEDLYNEITRKKKSAFQRERMSYEALENRLSVYVHGPFSFLNNQTSVDLENDLVCFDISSMPPQVKPTVMYLIMDFVHRKMQKDRERKTLVIDEAWSLLRFADSSKSIFELVKTARKFGLGLLIITQEVEDLLSSTAGKTILANTAWKYLSRQEPAAIEELAEKFHLNNEEQNYLLTAMPGEGLLFAMNDHIPLKVIPSPQEYRLITTNPDELKQKGR